MTDIENNKAWLADSSVDQKLQETAQAFNPKTPQRVTTQSDRGSLLVAIKTDEDAIQAIKEITALVDKQVSVLGQSINRIKDLGEIITDAKNKSSLTAVSSKLDNYIKAGYRVRDALPVKTKYWSIKRFERVNNFPGVAKLLSNTGEADYDSNDELLYAINNSDDWFNRINLIEAKADGASSIVFSQNKINTLTRLISAERKINRYEQLEKALASSSSAHDQASHLWNALYNDQGSFENGDVGWVVDYLIEDTLNTLARPQKGSYAVTLANINMYVNFLKQLTEKTNHSVSWWRSKAQK